MKKFILNNCKKFSLFCYFFLAAALFQAQAQNLVTNGDFEAATDLQGWSGFANQELTDADTNSRVGNVNANEGSLFQVFNVVAEETYDFSFDYKWVNNGQPNMNMTVRVRNEANNVSFEDIPLNSVEGVWDAANVAVTVPAGVTQVRILFYKGNTNKPLRIDNVIFEPQAALPCVTPTNINNPSVASNAAYFTWDASPSETDGYDWVVVNDGGDPDTPLDIITSGNVGTGVLNVSTTGLTESTAYDFYVRTRCASSQSDWTAAVSFTPSFQENLIVNSRFTTNETNASFSSWDGFNQDARIDNINGDFVGYIDNDGTLRQDVNVVPGVEYVISFNYRWLDTGRANGNDMNPTLRNPNVGGGAGNLQVLTLAENDSNIWYTVHYTYTLPSSQNTSQLRLQFFKAINRNQLHINNVTILENIDISAEADYVYKNGAWSPSNPAGVSTATDDVYVFNGTTEINSNLTANNLEVASWADVDVSATLDLVGTLTANGKVHFKNDATTLGQMGSGSAVGSVTVERFIPDGNRAFRLVTSSVDSDFSIFHNWQEHGVAPDNLGTHITGSETEANGFDVTATGMASLYTFDNTVENQTTDEVWFPISNTDVNTLDAGTLYRVFVRGDRNVNLTSNASAATETRLRATGELRTGTQTTGTNLPALSPHGGNFSATANPYQAIIDAENLTYNGDVNSSFIYVWDANEADNGKFVVVSTDGSSAPNPSSSSASQFIMPGQSFFIRNNTNAPNTPSLDFTEASKATTESQVGVFSENDALPYFNLRLYKTDDLNTDLPEIDAIGLRFNEQFTNEASDEDANKLGNPGENLAVINNGLLAIDNRSMPNNEETISLFVNSYSTTNYTFKAYTGNLPDNYKVFIDDAYTETSTEMQDGDTYQFTIDSSISESIDFQRFSLRFEVISLNTEDFENMPEIEIYPNPVKQTLHIATNNLENIEQVDVYNQIGQLVKVFKVGNNLEFDVSQLQTGVYFAKVSTQTTSHTSKFIKN